MIIIQPAQREDALAIQKLLRETWLDTYGSYLSKATLDEVYKNWQSVEFLTKQIENKEIYFPVAKEAGKLLGIATARNVDGKTILYRLYVHPFHQRQGIGQELLKSVEKYFPKNRKLQLHVEVLNEKGQSFYKKQGFKEIKREEEKVIDEVLEEILMEKEVYVFYLKHFLISSTAGSRKVLQVKFLMPFNFHQLLFLCKKVMLY